MLRWQSAPMPRCPGSRCSGTQVHLTPADVIDVDKQQSLFYGTSGYSIQDNLNNFCFLLSSKVENNVLSPYVQAPIATQDEIMAYVQSLSSDRSLCLANQTVNSNDNIAGCSPPNSITLFPDGGSTSHANKRCVVKWSVH